MEKVKRCLLWLVFVMAVLVFIGSGSFAEVRKGSTEKQIAIEEKKESEVKVSGLKDIDNPDAEFKVEIWTDRKDATYRVGDEIVFYFKTNKDCRLTLFNVGTSGDVQVIFPNEYQKDNLVKAGKEYRIPDEKAGWMYKAKGPAGTDLVKAIATLEKVELVAQTDVRPAGPVQEVTKPQSELAKDIEILLKPVDSKRWSEAEIELSIKE